MRITKKSNYLELLNDKTIRIVKKTNSEFMIYAPLGTSRETLRDIATWYYKKENDIPEIYEIERYMGFKKVWNNGRNWSTGDFKFV